MLILQAILSLIPTLVPCVLGVAQTSDGRKLAPATTEWLVWTGRVRDEKGEWQTTPASETRAKISAEVARIQSKALVSRDIDAAYAELADVTIRATRPAWAGRREALVEIVTARAHILSELAPGTRFASTTIGLLVPAGARPGKYELEPASSADLEMQATELALPRLASLLGSLTKSAATTATGQDPIAAAVSDALEHGDVQRIRDLGRRAVPFLSAIAGTTLTDWKNPQQDPVFCLAGIDEAAAAQIVLRHFDAGGPLWRRRTVRAMNQMGGASSVLENDGTFLSSPDNQTPQKLVDTGWLPVVARLVQDPETALDALPFVRSVGEHDAIDPPIVSAVGTALRQAPPAFTSGLLRILQEVRGRATLQPVLDMLIDSDDPAVRDFAANRLLDYRFSAKLRAGIESPYPQIRIALAISLRRHPIAYATYSGERGVTTGIRNADFELEDDESALLDRLARDSDVSVRLEALRSIEEMQAHLDDSTWLALAKDPDERVRVALTKCRVGDRFTVREDLQNQVLTILALDGSRLVVGAVDIQLNGLPTTKERPGVDPFLSAIEARYRNKQVPAISNAMGQVMRNVLRTESGCALAARLARAGEDAWANALAGALNDQLVEKGRASGGRTLVRSDVKLPFDETELVRFVRAGWLRDRDRFEGLVRALSYFAPGATDPWLELARDATVPAALRLRALQIAAPACEAACVQIIHDTFVQLSGTGAKYEKPDLDLVNDLFRAIPEPMATSTLLALLRDKRVDGDLQFFATQGQARKRAPTSELADAILEKFLDQGGPETAVKQALDEVASRPRDKRGEWIARAVRSRTFQVKGVQLLAEHPEPADRPLLVECLTAPWSFSSMQTEALTGIGRYLDDESVAILLDAVGKLSSDDLVTQCYTQLQRIRTYQEEKQRWESRRRATASKDSAIDALLPLLESNDAEVRAQAARSLATLGAVEELPRLVRLLKDPDAGVRAATQRALDVLNASTQAPK